MLKEIKSGDNVEVHIPLMYMGLWEPAYYSWVKGYVFVGMMKFAGIEKELVQVKHVVSGTVTNYQLQNIRAC